MALELTPPEPGSRNPRRRVRELSSLLWLCGWGCVTAIALAALAIASQTEIASERLHQIFATNESSAIARMPSRMTQLESETQILAAQIRTLSTERDRLAGRIALLESTIDDMTGTIKKQAAATAAALAASAPQPPSRSASAPPAPPQSAETNAGVTATPVTTIAITRPANADTPPPQPTPLPPTRFASTTTNDPAAQPANQNEFGLELGAGTTMEAVRQRWTAVKANFGPLLSGMHPLAARDQRPGATGYRLVVGPLPNSAAASGLCAHFSAARTTCRAVKFDGDPILPQ
jgi:hypothetical protein